MADSKRHLVILPAANQSFYWRYGSTPELAAWAASVGENAPALLLNAFGQVRKIDTIQRVRKDKTDKGIFEDCFICQIKRARAFKFEAASFWVWLDTEPAYNISQYQKTDFRNDV
jgi:hypothetical protein